jgi:hypothetical protein
MMKNQLECRVVLLHGPITSELGMYDPLNMRYEHLGHHPKRDIPRVVLDLKTSIERAGHLVSFCERRA